VIEELKEESVKRGGDAADDGDKRKWMSTAQLWVNSEAKSDEVQILCNFMTPYNFLSDFFVCFTRGYL
jgi:hypothetical protein